MIQNTQDKKISEGMIRIQMFLFAAAFAVVIIASMLEGTMSYYNISSVTKEGAFTIAGWSEAMYISTAKGGVNLISFHGISFIGYILMAGSLSLAALNSGLGVIKGKN